MIEDTTESCTIPAFAATLPVFDRLTGVYGYDLQFRDGFEAELVAALSASGIKAAMRAHAQYQRDPAELLRQVNTTLWTGSAGDQHAAMLFALVETATGQVRYSMAGHPSIIHLRPDGWKSLAHVSP